MNRYIQCNQQLKESGIENVAIKEHGYNLYVIPWNTWNYSENTYLGNIKSSSIPHKGDVVKFRLKGNELAEFEVDRVEFNYVFTSIHFTDIAVDVFLKPADLTTTMGNVKEFTDVYLN